jgi:hypothetical protein
MTDKQPMQADGTGTDGSQGTNAAARDASGESGGGAYPNPHTGKKDHPGEGFLGHGGQTDIAYHGTGQLGHEQVGDDENPNAATKDD